MNRIFIENYTLISKHGFYKEEHFKPQRFVVSVWCDVLENQSGETDNLKDTFNYEKIRSVVKEVVLGEHRKLLEKLAGEIADKLLTENLVLKVEVKIAKPDIWGDCEPGVQIKRAK